MISTLDKIIPVIQTSVAPMILISGVGLLLLSMTNRLGRIIDKARILAKEPVAIKEDQKIVDDELKVLWNRANHMRYAILLSCAACLNAAALITLMFMSAMLSLDIVVPIVTMFTLSLSCLMVSIIFFILDVNLNLTALKMEFGRQGIKL
jgi:hypothetical protein